MTTGGLNGDLPPDLLDEFEMVPGLLKTKSKAQQILAAHNKAKERSSKRGNSLGLGRLKTSSQTELMSHTAKLSSRETPTGNPKHVRFGAETADPSADPKSMASTTGAVRPTTEFLPSAS